MPKAKSSLSTTKKIKKPSRIISQNSEHSRMDNSSNKNSEFISKHKHSKTINSPETNAEIISKTKIPKYSKTYESKKNLTRRFLLYGLSAILISILSVSLTAWLKGYRLSRSGKITSNGLILIQPIDKDTSYQLDQNEPKSAPDKIVVPIGEHTLKVTKDSYQDWNLKLNTKVESLTILSYLKLIPKEFKSQNLTPSSTVENIALSAIDESSGRTLIINKVVNGEKLNYQAYTTILSDDISASNFKSISLPEALFPLDAPTNTTLSLASPISKDLALLKYNEKYILLDINAPQNSSCASCQIDLENQAKTPAPVTTRIWLDNGKIFATDNLKNLHSYTPITNSIKNSDNLKYSNISYFYNNSLINALNGVTNELIIQSNSNRAKLATEPANINVINSGQNAFGIASSGPWVINYNTKDNVLNLFFKGQKINIAHQFNSGTLHFSDMTENNEIIIYSEDGKLLKYDITDNSAEYGILPANLNYKTLGIKLINNGLILIHDDKKNYIASLDASNSFALPDSETLNAYFTKNLKTLYQLNSGVVKTTL